MSLPTSPKITNLLNGTMSSVLSSAPLKSSNISGMNIAPSVSSDKLFQSVSSSKTSSNVFGVFDTKQAVCGLSGSTISNTSTEQVSKIPVNNFNNLQNKTGTQLTSDLAYQDAVVTVMGNVISAKQVTLSIGNTMLSVTLSPPISQRPAIYSNYGNVNTPAQISNVVPNTMSSLDYSQLQSIYNQAGGLNNYNTCPNVANAFGLGNSLLTPEQLLAQLMALMQMIARYDMAGMLNCLAGTQSALTIQQQAGLTNILISGGSVNGMNDYCSSGYNGTVIDPADTLRTIGTNRQTTYDPFTRQPNNTFNNPTVAAASDNLFINLGITDKSTIFSVQATNATRNPSITDGMSDNLYDRDAINSIPPDNGFTNHCFDGNGTDMLIRSIPDSLFV